VLDFSRIDRDGVRVLSTIGVAFVFSREEHQLDPIEALFLIGENR
jgi:hypothetical protein